jgi:hypothetical protein
LKPNKEDPHEEEPHEENDGETLRTGRPPHEGLLVRRRTRSMIAQRNPALVKGSEQKEACRPHYPNKEATSSAVPA